MDRFEDAVLRIKEATDLVALVESYLPLKPRGRNLIALCPFHAESTPSFHVSREKQFYKCFGCGKAGDVFTWLMERDGLTFREAMELLAERAGVALDGVFAGRDPERSKAAQDAHGALAAVAGFFAQALLGSDGALAREYLDRRGLGEAIGPWRIGYHPVGGALQRFAAAQRLPRDVLEAAGLLRGDREPFRGRVMFPIEDERGRVVGFGGRIVPGGPGSEPDGDYTPPKYLNSPESPLFHKRRVLFGLSRAKQSGQRRLLVMEGYTDVIACHLAGFPGAVASLGTAFTADHARTVERYASDGVVLMFDGDRAGVQAAERAVRELVGSRLAVRIAMVGEAGDGSAKDPADLLTARPGEDPEWVAERRVRFADLVDSAEPMLTVWFRLLRRRLDLTQAVHIETAARECAGVLQRIEEPLRQSACLQEMARHLLLPVATLERLLAQAPKPARPADEHGARPKANVGPVPQRGAAGLAERSEFELLACVLAKPTLVERWEHGIEPPLGNQAVVTLLAMVRDGVALGRTSSAELMRYLFARAAEAPELRELLGSADERASGLTDAEAVCDGLLAGRRRLALEPKKRGLQHQLQQALAAGDRDRAAAVQAELLALLRADLPRPAAAPGAPSAPRAAGPQGSAPP
ncbi:MAG: DNA primase [Planctomycetes bacterium]|nr:DNA primase [Planctomycetota bacterium]